MTKIRGPRPRETTLFGTVGCTLTPEYRSKLRRVALSRDISMSQLVRDCVSAWLDEQEDPGDVD